MQNDFYKDNFCGAVRRKGDEEAAGSRKLVNTPAGEDVYSMRAEIFCVCAKYPYLCRYDTKADIGLREAQAVVDSWIRTTGVRYFSPLTNMAVLAEEVGEVARIMARRYGDQSFKDGESDAALADELADVMWVVMALANQSGIDLADAFRKISTRRTVAIRNVTEITLNFIIKTNRRAL